MDPEAGDGGAAPLSQSVPVPVEPPPPYEAAQAAGPPAPPPAPPAAAPAQLTPARAADKAVRFELPPAYDAVTNPAKLPSYDEVQQEKAREAGPPPVSGSVARGRRVETGTSGRARGRPGTDGVVQCRTPRCRRSGAVSYSELQANSQRTVQWTLDIQWCNGILWYAWL